MTSKTAAFVLLLLQIESWQQSFVEKLFSQKRILITYQFFSFPVRSWIPMDCESNVTLKLGLYFFIFSSSLKHSLSANWIFVHFYSSVLRSKLLTVSDNTKTGFRSNTLVRSSSAKRSELNMILCPRRSFPLLSSMNYCEEV